MTETGECSQCENEPPKHLMEMGLCPKCAEKKRIEEMEIERMTRDPTREPY